MNNKANLTDWILNLIEFYKKEEVDQILNNFEISEM
jgi:hypothetical protein